MQYALLFRHFLLLEVQIVQYCRFSVIGSRFFGRDGNAVSTSGQFADHELHELTEVSQVYQESHAKENEQSIFLA